MTRMTTEGFVLAGGLSRRMGQDKALLLVEGMTLLDRAVHLLRDCGLEAGVLCGSNRILENPAVPCFPDVLGGMGPLGGLYTGLKRMSGESALFLACDLPFVTPTLVKRLLEAGETADITVPEDSRGVVQPFCGVYRRSCLIEVGRMLAEGRLKTVELLQNPDLEVQILSLSDAGFSDRLLLNLNSPEDFELINETRR